jgi:hypothetical protein
MHRKTKTGSSSLRRTPPIPDDPVLHQLLTTGVVAPLYFSMSPEDVVQVLGQPDEEYQPYLGDDTHLAYIYKNILMGFYECKLDLYTIHFFMDEGLPDSMPGNWYQILKTLTSRQLVAHAQALGLHCQKYELVDGVDELILVVKYSELSYITVIFDGTRKNRIDHLICSNVGLPNRKLLDW